MKNLCLLFLFILNLCSGIQNGLAQNGWTAKANFGGTARYGATGFSIGGLCFMGLGYDGSYKNDWWAYDTASNSWSQKANFAGGPRHSSTGFRIGSKGYVGTGLYGSDIFSDFYEYSPSLNTWTPKASFPGSPRYAATGLCIMNKGYIGLGTSGSSGPFYNDWWEYYPDTDTWLQKANFAGTVRSGASAFAINSKGFVCGGSNYPLSLYYNDLWRYDPGPDVWTQKASLPAAARSSGTAFTIQGRGYYGTGCNFSSGISYKDFWEYDPNSNTWGMQADLPSSRWGASGFSIGVKGFVAAGNLGNGYSNSLFEICKIPGQPATIQGPAEICTGASVTYTTPVVPGAVSYSWTLPQGWTGTSSTTSITGTAGSTSGVITVTANNACGSSVSQSMAVTVYPLPAVPQITQNGNVLTSSFQYGNQWYWNSVILPGDTLQNYTATQNGNYTVSVTNSYGCSSTSSIITINTLAIEHLTKNDGVEIFPNPNYGFFTINIKDPSLVPELIITNIQGKIIYRSTLVEQKTLIDISFQPKGIYFVQVGRETENIFKKIVIQ
jgi:N-acetylneuraminic acid mutarotase